MATPKWSIFCVKFFHVQFAVEGRPGTTSACRQPPMGRGGSVAETMDTAASNTSRKPATPNIVSSVCAAEAEHEHGSTCTVRV